METAWFIYSSRAHIIDTRQNNNKSKIFDICQQNTLELKVNGKKVEQNVTADLTENYIEHHMQYSDKEVWLVNDFNRVRNLYEKSNRGVTVIHFISEVSKF